MQKQNRIHLVGSRELQAAIESQKTNPLVRMDPKDIVRETLTIANECGIALADVDVRGDQLLVDLVSSLVAFRLRKAGAR